MERIVDQTSYVDYATMQHIADDNTHVDYPTIAIQNEAGMGYQNNDQSTDNVQYVPVLYPYYVVVSADEYAKNYGHGDGQAATRGPSGGRPREVSQRKAKQSGAWVSPDQVGEPKLMVKKTVASGNGHASKASSGSTSGGTEHEFLSGDDSRSDGEGVSEPWKEPQTPPLPTGKFATRNGWGSSHAVDPPSKPPGFFAPRNDSSSLPHIEHMPTHVDSRTFWTMSMNKNGCRIVQDAIETGSPAYRQELVENLRGQVHRAYQSPNANFVLQKIIQVMPSEHYSFLLEELERQVDIVVRHRFGCRILQRILEHCEPEQTEPLMEKVVRDAPALIRHQFGNFVLQHILQYGSPAHRHIIADVVHADILRLAKHRLASHVVSCALVHCSSEDAHRLVHALRDDPKELAQLSRREFGSFVVREVNRAARIQGV